MMQRRRSARNQSKEKELVYIYVNILCASSKFLFEINVEAKTKFFKLFISKLRATLAIFIAYVYHIIYTYSRVG